MRACECLVCALRRCAAWALCRWRLRHSLTCKTLWSSPREMCMCVCVTVGCVTVACVGACCMRIDGTGCMIGCILVRQTRPNAGVVSCESAARSVDLILSFAIIYILLISLATGYVAAYSRGPRYRADQPFQAPQRFIIVKVHARRRQKSLFAKKSFGCRVCRQANLIFKIHQAPCSWSRCKVHIAAPCRCQAVET